MKFGSIFIGVYVLHNPVFSLPILPALGDIIKSLFWDTGKFIMEARIGKVKCALFIYERKKEPQYVVFS